MASLCIGAGIIPSGSALRGPDGIVAALVNSRALIPLALGAMLGGCARAPKPAAPQAFPLGTIWTVSLDAALTPPLGLDERRIYVATRDGDVRALSRQDGAQAWRAKGLGGLVSAAPGVVVVRTPEGKVSSLQPRTGEVRWATESSVPGAIPAVIDRDLVFVAGSGLVALDAASGKLIWSAPLGPIATSLPVVAGSQIVVGEADGTLRGRDRTTGASLWTFRTAEPLLAPVAIDERGEVFVGTTDRRLLRLGPKGNQHWRWRVGADVISPPALAGDLALFTSFDATLYAIHRGSGKLAWRVGLPSRPLSGPLVVGQNVLVACHESEIVGFSLAKGEAMGALKLPAEIRAPPLESGGHIFVGLRDLRVVALQVAGQP